MDNSALMLWSFFIGTALVFIIGTYCILATFNLIRALIGVELLTKAVTLLLILAGRISGNMSLAQAFVITLIVIEVVVMVVAAGIVIAVFRKYGSIDIKLLRKLKG